MVSGVILLSRLGLVCMEVAGEGQSAGEVRPRDR